MPSRPPIALTIAGSDSGGGAGIQADTKTMSAHGVFAASVLTAITAQNTTAVTAVQEVPADVVAAQIHAVLSDLDVRAIKLGCCPALQSSRQQPTGLPVLPARSWLIP